MLISSSAFAAAPRISCTYKYEPIITSDGSATITKGLDLNPGTTIVSIQVGRNSQVLAHDVDFDVVAYAAARAKELGTDIEFFGLRRDDRTSIIVKATTGKVSAENGIQFEQRQWNFGTDQFAVTSSEVLSGLTCSRAL